MQRLYAKIAEHVSVYKESRLQKDTDASKGDQKGAERDRQLEREVQLSDGGASAGKLQQSLCQRGGKPGRQADRTADGLQCGVEADFLQQGGCDKENTDTAAYLQHDRHAV